MASCFALRTILPITANRAVDNPRIDLLECLITNAKPVKYSRSEGLEHNIGLANKVEEHFTASVVL